MWKLALFVALFVQLMTATADDGPCPANEVRRCGEEYTCKRPCIFVDCGVGCAAPPWPCLCELRFVRFQGKCRPYQDVCELK